MSCRPAAVFGLQGHKSEQEQMVIRDHQLHSPEVLRLTFYLFVCR